MSSAERDARKKAILDYLREHPGSTARQIYTAIGYSAREISGVLRWAPEFEESGTCGGAITYRVRP